MAMAPKKKYDFYNSGRGIEAISLSDSHDVHSESSSSPRPTFYDFSPIGSSTRLSSPIQEPASPVNCHSSTVSPHHSSFTSPTVYQPNYMHHGASMAGSYSRPESPDSCYGSFREEVPSPYASFDPSTYRQAGERSINREEAPPTYTVYDDEDPKIPKSRSQSNSRGQKRPQRCRMCANHEQIVDMKGHKWYCPYRDCTCEHCDITRKTQFYMKERQKLTRHQQQNASVNRYQGQQVGAEAPGRRRLTEQGTMDFPRVDEMVSQTSDILDYDLFERVNQACRPRTSSNLPQ